MVWAGCWRGGRGGPFLSPRQSWGDGGIVYSASRDCRVGGAASQRCRRPPRRGGKGRSCRPLCPTPEVGVPVPSGGSRALLPLQGRPGRLRMLRARPCRADSRGSVRGCQPTGDSTGSCGAGDEADSQATTSQEPRPAVSPRSRLRVWTCAGLGPQGCVLVSSRGHLPHCCPQELAEVARVGGGGFAGFWSSPSATSPTSLPQPP